MIVRFDEVSKESSTLYDAFGIVHKSLQQQILIVVIYSQNGKNFVTCDDKFMSVLNVDIYGCMK